MIKDALLCLLPYPFAWLTKLCERGTQVIIAGNITVKNGAIMLRHLERGMTEQVLKCKSIAPAVHQIFPGKRMAEHMDTRFQNAPLVIVVRNRQFQCVL